MKKPLQIITLFMLLPILGFSQNKYSIGLNINAALNYLKMQNSTFERGEAYSLGIQAQYALSERIFLRSGINYQNNKYHDIREVRWPSGGNSITQNDITIRSIGIPVDVGYQLKSKNQNINYLLGFGGLVNRNFDSITKVQGLGDPSEFKNGIDRTSYSISAFVGVELQLNDKIILGVEPNFRYGSIFKSQLSKSRSIESGITLRIRSAKI